MLSLHTHAKHAEEQEKNELISVPVLSSTSTVNHGVGDLAITNLIIRDLQQNNLPCAEWIEETQSHSRDHSTEEAGTSVSTSNIRHKTRFTSATSPSVGRNMIPPREKIAHRQLAHRTRQQHRQRWPRSRSLGASLQPSLRQRGIRESLCETYPRCSHTLQRNG